MLTMSFVPSQERSDECDAVIELPCGRRAVVRVDRVRKGKVRVGFEFPPEYKISRLCHADKAGVAAVDRINERIAQKAERVTA